MILRERYTKIPANNSSTNWNTISDLRGNLEQITINPSSSSTIYDFYMTDDDGNIVYNKKGLKGTFVDDSKIGVFGIYTINISNASILTNSFTCTLIWNENL